MKKLVKFAYAYAFAALICGVFYREFTKALAFDGRTALAFKHPHLLGLGTLFFLVLALFSIKTDLSEQKGFSVYLVVYSAGLCFTVLMLGVRGVLQVLQAAGRLSLSAGLNSMVSGLAGLGHIALGTGLILILSCLSRSAVQKA